MPAGELAVSDTSPLRNLALIGRLDLLQEQFDTIVIPEQVWDELSAGRNGTEDLRTLRDRGFLVTTEVDETELYVEIVQKLDIGETAAITHAIDNEADLVLLDERDGRRVARRHGLTVTGAIGIPLQGKQDGSVDLRTGLDTLRSDGFWIDDERYDAVLDQR